MTETKWTPGPWHVVPYGDGDSLVICSDVEGNWRICFMATHGGSRSAWEKIQAEANLIAASPLLYEALVACVAYINDPEKDTAAGITATLVVHSARAALAAARGEGK